MTAKTQTRRPPSGGTTRRPQVDQREPVKSPPKVEAEAETGEEKETETGKVAKNTEVAATSGDPALNNAEGAGDGDEDAGDSKSGPGEDKKRLAKGMSEPDVSAGGGDGATMTPATGTCSDLADKLSTKEGDAPIGVEQDSRRQGERATGPDTWAAAALSSAAPAGTLLAGKQSAEVTEQVFTTLRGFSAQGDDARIVGASNIHDDLGVSRAHIVHFGAALESEFGIDITPSEIQNVLLARDAVNLVLRKLAKQD